jgi:hypothetical protein
MGDSHKSTWQRPFRYKTGRKGALEIRSYQASSILWNKDIGD